jgi:hypothetical protein
MRSAARPPSAGSAASAPFRAAVEALANLGADLGARCRGGATPLHLAAFVNQMATMEVQRGGVGRSGSRKGGVGSAWQGRGKGLLDFVGRAR